MSNIRLFFKESLSLNLTAKLDKSQSHYVNKVMRIKVGEVFSLFNNSGEWEAKILTISKRLKEKNYKLGILSNGTPSLLNELVKSNNLDNIFDDIFSIEEVGIYKPDSKVYDMPIKKYKIQKEEVAFLSANTWDVSGGGNYGYSSIWVNRNNNIFDNLDYKPKDEVKNLKQLLDII
ncbi:HAD-IA family hydrolase [Candidatus Pelagibacter ubique]|nr:HAD-IA family hydrolase [Candidatus Pelagibacter ubique]